MRKVVLFLFPLLLIAQTAIAAPAINAEGAAKLKTEVEENISFRKKMTEITKQGITLSGDIEVTPKDSFYEVKIPGLAVISPGTKLDIGTVVIHATPGDKGEYTTTTTIPSPIISRDDKGVAEIELTIGKQSFSGTWWPSLGAYTAVDAAFDDILVKGLTKEHNFNFKINSVASMIALKQNADNTWSGPQGVEVNGISATAPAAGQAGDRKMTIARLTGDAAYDKVDLVATAVLRKKFEALFKDGKAPSQEAINAAVQDIYSDQKSLFDGAVSNFAVNDVYYEAAPGAGAKPEDKPFILRLAKFTSFAEARNMLQEKSAGQVRMNLSGLSAPNADAETQAVIATTANLDVAADNVPARDISKVMSEIAILSTQASDPKKADEIRTKIETLSRSIGVLLGKAGASLTIRDTFFDAPELDLKIDGKLTAKESVTDMPLASTGAVTLSITGMDELLLKTPAAGAPPNQTKQLLTVMQMMGQPGKAPDGKSLRTYKLEASPDGRILLNGADISALSAMMGGLKAVPPAPQKATPATPAPAKKAP